MNPWGISKGRFRPADRLLDAKDFRRVLKRGRRLRHPHFVVVVARGRRKESDPDGQEAGLGARLGITASRKVGHAVARNRFKRRVREWFRRRQEDIRRVRGDIDLVVIARPTAPDLTQLEIDRGLSDLLGLGSREESVRRSIS